MKYTLFFYALLVLLVLFRLLTFQPAAILRDGQQLSFTTQLTTVPYVKANIQELSLQYQGNTLTVRTAVFPVYSYGQKIQVAGSVSTKVLDGGRTINTMYFPKITVLPSHNIFALAGWVRGRVKAAFARSLPPTSSSLLMGIVFGGKENLPKSFTTSLQRTGLTHVVAASGMNVSLFAGFLLALTLPLLRRQHAVILCLAGIGFYLLLAGFEPSIVRASIMAIFAFGASLFGRQNTGLLSLSLTAFVMLFFDPLLLSDVGFQLSIASTAGIMLIEPMGRGNTPSFLSGESPFISFVSEDLQTTIAAQLATLPIMLFHFQQYGIFSVLVNGLLLWVIAPLMIIGLLAAAFAVVLIPLGSLISFLGLPFLWLFETVVTVLGSNLPMLKLPALPFSLVAGYYCFLSAFLLWRKRGEPWI